MKKRGGKNEKGREEGRRRERRGGGRSKGVGVMMKGASEGRVEVGVREGGFAICSQLKGGAADGGGHGGERSVGSNDQSAGHTGRFLF